MFDFITNFYLYLVIFSVYSPLSGLILTAAMAIVVHNMKTGEQGRLVAVLEMGFGIAGLCFAIGLISRFIFRSAVAVPIYIYSNTECVSQSRCLAEGGGVVLPLNSMLWNTIEGALITTAIIVSSLILYHVFNRTCPLWHVIVCAYCIFIPLTLGVFWRIPFPAFPVSHASAILANWPIPHNPLEPILYLILFFCAYLTISTIVSGIIIAMVKIRRAD